jgi:hypothetical protein
VTPGLKIPENGPEPEFSGISNLDPMHHPYYNYPDAILFLAQNPLIHMHVHWFGENNRDSLLSQGQASIQIVMITLYSSFVAGLFIHVLKGCSGIL